MDINDKCGWHFKAFKFIFYCWLLDNPAHICRTTILRITMISVCCRSSTEQEPKQDCIDFLMPWKLFPWLFTITVLKLIIFDVLFLVYHVSAASVITLFFDSSLGFCSLVFDAEQPCENECCLMLDVMSIRCYSPWDSNLGKFVGHINYGGHMENSNRLVS